MTATDHWQRVGELFGEALDMAPHERRRLLDAACRDAPELRAEVERLLALHQRADDFLQPPTMLGAAPPPAAPPNDAMIGRAIGRYRIIRRIASGGMSVVYEAEQDSPRRRVALKMVHPSLMSEQLLRRLTFEAEVLARLRHPGIAQVFEAGVHDLGDGAQPYFAMELVDGEPVTAYAASKRLDVRGRVQLLIDIALAVQHAHEKGVIHRDLKPANILVEESIGASRHQEIKASSLDASMPRSLDVSRFASRPRPKVLDFGVARLTDADLHLTAMHTAAGVLVGTIRYMSPEQVSGDGGDIDTRADVYALGVVGYELLTGRLPYDPPTGTIASVINTIERGEVIPLGQVDRAFRGDLECIFAKALEHDRQRRYSSAAEFADDLGRYLGNETVRARPPTAFYQARKFARRHRALVGGIATTVVALAVGLVLYAFEARQARFEAARSRYEADKATAINNFITNDFLMKLLAAANAGNGSQPLPVGELVDQAAGSIDSMFAGQPLAEAAVRNEVGTIYYNLAMFDKAAAQFQRALDQWEAELGPDHGDTLKAVNNLGQAMMHLGRSAEAESLYRRALDGRTRVLGEGDPLTLVTMNNLGSLYQSLGRLDEAEAMLRRTLESQRRVHGPTHKNTLTTMANLGTLLIKRGKIEEALAMHQQAYDASRETLGADHVTTLVAGSRLGQTLDRAGRSQDACNLLVNVAASFDRTLGAGHTSTILARRTLARVYRSLGQRDEAAAQLRLALDAARAKPDRSEKLVNEIQRDLDAMTESPSTTQGAQLQ